MRHPRGGSALLHLGHQGRAQGRGQGEEVLLSGVAWLAQDAAQLCGRPRETRLPRSHSPPPERRPEAEELQSGAVELCRAGAVP